MPLTPKKRSKRTPNYVNGWPVPTGKEPMARHHTHVWVLELAVLEARRQVVGKWEIWQAFNTRAEAMEERDKDNGKKFALPKFMYRIRKYVPEAIR